MKLPGDVPRVTGVPEVGKVYLVPCFLSEDGLVPVFPHPHDDLDIGGAPRHCHLDFRFIDDAARRVLTARAGKNTVSVVLVAGDPPYVWCPRPCVRRWVGADPYDRQRSVLSEVHGLAEVCRDLVCGGRVCPHKGFPLDGVTRDRRGNRTCPLHGATWGRDGRFVPTRNNAQRMLRRFLEGYDRDAADVVLRLFAASRDHKNLRLLRCDQFEECPHYAPAPIRLVVDRAELVVSFPDITLLFSGPASVAGFYLTREGYDRPLWGERFSDSDGVQRPLVLPPGGGTVTVSAPVF